MTHDRILLFIPCYRCGEQIGRVIRRMQASGYADRIARVLVVDNGSPDDTVEKAVGALTGSEFQDWRVVVNDRNVSLGGSHKVAFAHARENGFTHVLVVHGDDQAEPKNFASVFADDVHHHHDAVLGSRFMPGSRLAGYGWFRIFGNHVFNLLFRLATRRPILDLGSGLNLYGPAVITAQDERPACDDLTFHCDLLITMIERNRDLQYVPVDWREDDQVSNAKLLRQSWRILKILVAHAAGREGPAGRGKHAPSASYTSTLAGAGEIAERRSVCAVCGSDQIRPTNVRFSLPAYQGCISPRMPIVGQTTREMKFQSCDACDSVQIERPLPAALVYQGGHATGLGAAWAAHHSALCEFLRRESRGPILEFGGGAGTLARAYRARETGSHRPWTIVEPNPVLSEDPVADLSYEIGFFGTGSRVAPTVETVLFCHCLEHLPSVQAAARHLSEELSPGRRVVIAWPDLERWIEKGVPGAINWEHTFYCRIATLISVFERAGFKTAAHEPYGSGHSHFLAFERTDGLRPSTSGRTETHEHDAPSEGGVVPRGEELLAAYFEKFRAQAKALNAALDGRPYYLSPASIYGQALIAGGLAKNCLGLIDNAPVKQGLTLYGTGLTVYAPSQLKAGDVLVLNGGAHAEEMTRGFHAAQPDLVVLRAEVMLERLPGYLVEDAQ